MATKQNPGAKALKLIGTELKKRASWTHERLSLAQKLGTPLGEETLTETLLLDLRQELGSYLEVNTFTKWEESRRSGADWEWWFCDGAGERMFGMRVQAKKLKLTRAGVPYYDFAYKPRLSKKRQVDRLIEAARKERMPAVYALYNGPDLDLNAFSWTCCNEDPSDAIFGVSMISADSAQRLADSKDTTLKAAGGLSKPWSCCALCPGWLREESWHLWPDGDGSLSFYAADLVTDLMALDSEALGRSERERALEGASGYRTWEEAPAYVRRLVENASPTRDSRDSVTDLVNELDAPSNLGGVAAFIGKLPE